MSDIDGAQAPADSTPIIAATPQPVATEGEPSTAQNEETARQTEEAKVATEPKEPAKKAEPEAEKAKPLSARESLKKAAEKLEADSKPAKDAKPTAEKAAPLKDAPQPRAEDGKFAAKAGDKTEPAKEATTEPAKVADAPKPVADAKAAPEPKATTDAPNPKVTPPSFTGEDEPPSRASPDAKKDWANTPPSVRGEFNRAVKELTAGIEKYRPAAERDSEIAEFHDLAAKGGTTVKEALAKYVGMENQLRADPIKGLEIICQNAGMSLREVAAHIMGQTPEQNASQTDATIRELRATVSQLQQQVSGVTQTFEQQRAQTTQQKVEAFAADHPRFEELADDIAFFMKAGRTKDLAEAYSLAERLNPAPAKVNAELSAPASTAAVAEIAKATPDLSVQTERGSKSIAGSPTPGSDPVSRQPSKSIKDSLRRAMAAAG